MKLLVLGGTVFVGRHLVETALAAGHDVTLFNRGRTDPNLFEGRGERLVGDREGDLDALDGRTWDVVVDTVRSSPSMVERSARRLASSASLYIFVSTISVYRDFMSGSLDEASPVALTDDIEDEELTAETYGPLKVLCEAAAREVFGADRTLVVRPGLIVGPHDPTDRFTYWTRRLETGGDILAPGTPDRPVQFIDVRDLSTWIIDAAERRLAGTFNATGPAMRLSMGEFLEVCREVVVARNSTDGDNATDVVLHWVDEDFLATTDLAPYTQLPLWLPASRFRFAQEVDCTKAIAAGLRFRPLRETIDDTMAWDRRRGRPDLMAGLESAAECHVLSHFDCDGTDAGVHHR